MRGNRVAYLLVYLYQWFVCWARYCPLFYLIIQIKPGLPRYVTLLFLRPFCTFPAICDQRMLCSQCLTTQSSSMAHFSIQKSFAAEDRVVKVLGRTFTNLSSAAGCIFNRWFLSSPGPSRDLRNWMEGVDNVAFCRVLIAGARLSVVGTLSNDTCNKSVAANLNRSTFVCFWIEFFLVSFIDQ